MEQLIRGLTPEKVNEYQAAGVVRFDGPIFEGEKLKAFQKECFRIADKHIGPGKSGTYDRIIAFEPRIWPFIRDPKLLDYVESLIGPNIAVTSINIFIKRANSPKYVEWHTDAHAYYTMKYMDDPKFLAVLLAVTDSELDNGCVKYVAGSHTKHGRKYKNEPYKECLFGDPNTFDWQAGTDNFGPIKKTMFGKGQGFSGVEDAEIDPKLPIVPIEMKAGWASGHSAHVIHGSDANNSERDRMLLNIKFIPTDIKLNTEIVLKTFGSIQNGILVRGKDISGTCIDPFELSKT